MVKDYDLSDEEIENGIMGGGLDGGCDAIYIFSNGILMNDDAFESLAMPKEMKLELVIIQAKNTTSFKEEAIMKWKSISENLLQFSNAIGDFAGRYSEDVLRAFEKFRLLHLKAIRSRVKLYFNYIYVTLASELHPNVKAQGSELECIIRRLFPSKNVVAGVKFVNADALMDRINSIPETRFVLPLSDTPININDKKTKVLAFSLLVLFGGILGWIGYIIPIFFNPWINYISYPAVQLITLIALTIKPKQGQQFGVLKRSVHTGAHSLARQQISIVFPRRDSLHHVNHGLEDAE